jgi:hypothetical protein
MHVSKDSMWRGIWKILQNFLGTKQGPKVIQVIDLYTTLNEAVQTKFV